MHAFDFEFEARITGFEGTKIFFHSPESCLEGGRGGGEMGFKHKIL
jgi:hypothetical protein